MATTVDWVTGVITILQADMTPLGGDVYELDMDTVRLELKALEDDGEGGMPWPDTHFHTTEQTISGITFARAVVILAPYTVTIDPAGAYQVSCVGANHNLQDRYNNLTGPTLLPNLSAGLVSLSSIAASLTSIETDIGFAVVDAEIARKIEVNRTETDPVTGIMTVYDDDGVTPWRTAAIWQDAAGTIPYAATSDGADRRDALV